MNAATDYTLQMPYNSELLLSPLIVSTGGGIGFRMSVTQGPLGGPRAYSVVDGRCAGSFPETEYQSLSARD